jgi:predicted nucleic acid-binding protein
MSVLVLDCSVTMAWCFEDECDPLADAVLDVVGDMEVWVPSLWPIEVANVLLVAERRKRLKSADSARFIELLARLPIQVDGAGHERALGPVIAKGRELGLSAYDASYVDLAERRGATLATRDKKLMKVCRGAGIDLFETPR